MSNIAAIVLGLVLLLSAPAPGGRPVIEPGRDAEMEQLFADVGDAAPGCEVPDIEVPFNVLRPEIVCDDGRLLTLEFRYPVRDPAAVASTPSFEVFVRSFSGIGPGEADALARTVAAHVALRDDGKFWRAFEGGSPESSWSAGPASILGSLAGFCLLALGLGTWFLVRRPWQTPEHRLALTEMGLLALGAFLVRWWLVPAGPTNILIRLVDPRNMPGIVPQLGPGHAGWMASWFTLLGTEGNAAYLAGAVAGALTVVPVYILAWKGGGRRTYGLASAALLALWQIHALLSPSDEPAGLATLLMMTALALVCLARRSGTAALVLLAWLAGCLAALSRPEHMLVLPACGLLVLLGRKSRRAQLRVHVLAFTLAMLVLTSLALMPVVITRWTNVDPAGGLRISSLARLLGAGGGSILLPPRTHVLLSIAFLASVIPAVRATRGRAAAWLLTALAVALPTAAMAFPNMVTSRYQLPLVAVAAVVTGVGLVRLGALAVRSWPRTGLHLRRAIMLAVLCTAAWGVLRPPPPPTFQLEYAFFRQGIASIPGGCKIVEVRWDTDLGLVTPSYLSRFLGLDHTWIEPGQIGDPDRDCVIYWRAGSCHAAGNNEEVAPGRILPVCAEIEEGYRLEPMLTAELPPRTGFCEQYTLDPVPVGFYRLRGR